MGGLRHGCGRRDGAVLEVELERRGRRRRQAEVDLRRQVAQDALVQHLVVVVPPRLAAEHLDVVVLIDTPLLERSPRARLLHGKQPRLAVRAHAQLGRVDAAKDILRAVVELGFVDVGVGVFVVREGVRRLEEGVLARLGRRNEALREHVGKGLRLRVVLWGQSTHAASAPRSHGTREKPTDGTHSAARL